MASIVVVAAAVAASVPVVALKEALHKRMRRNMSKHLGRRSACRVRFANPAPTPVADSSKDEKIVYEIDIQRASTPPPNYDELFLPAYPCKSCPVECSHPPTAIAC